MQQVFGILTDPASGGTFLDWTIHFLSGHERFYNGRPSWSTLTKNPLNGINAHNHLPCQVGKTTKMNTTLNKLHNQSTQSFHSIYYHYSHGDTFSDAVDAVNAMIKQTEKLIVASSFDRKNLLFNSVTDRIGINSMEVLLRDYLPEGNLYKNNAWDLREFFAISYLHRTSHPIFKILNPTLEFYKLDTLDLYQVFDQKVESLFSYLNITVNYSRFPDWLNIYTDWKKIHQKSINWDKNFDKIVQAIVVGDSINLLDYELDLMQEAAIMQHLILDYNLTIKGYALEKFPSNTKDLHLLLEPNFHKVMVSPLS